MYFSSRPGLNGLLCLWGPQWGAAASDCTEAVALDDKYVKAYSRRGTAYEEADDLERSLADYNRVRFSAVTK